MKDSVKTDIAKAEFINSHFELSLAVLANQCARKIGPHRKIKETIHWPCRVFEIHGNVSGWSLLRLSCKRSGRKDGREAKGEDKERAQA